MYPRKGFNIVIRILYLKQINKLLPNVMGVFMVPTICTDTFGENEVRRLPELSEKRILEFSSLSSGGVDEPKLAKVSIPRLSDSENGSGRV